MALRSRTGACVLAILAVLSLSACATRSPSQELAAVKPAGSAFSKALFADYAALARSLGLADLPGRTAFDAEDAFSLTDIAPDVAGTAMAYARKAKTAANGEEPLPEAAPTDDNAAEDQRLDLLRALFNARAKAPVEAARTQAQFDCWVINETVPALARAAAACKRGFEIDLAHLKSFPGMMDPPAEAAADQTGQPKPAVSGEAGQ